MTDLEKDLRVLRKNRDISKAGWPDGDEMAKQAMKAWHRQNVIDIVFVAVRRAVHLGKQHRSYDEAGNAVMPFTDEDLLTLWSDQSRWNIVISQYVHSGDDIELGDDLKHSQGSANPTK